MQPSYVGCGRDIAALVRSDAPIPIECGIYYYEMHIISKGEHGYIGIGFCHRENNLDILPGMCATTLVATSSCPYSNVPTMMML